MKILKRLALAGDVEIYVPELVKREFLTRRVMESIGKLQEAYNKLSFVLKKINKENELQTILTENQQSIRSMEDRLEKDIGNDFEKWVEDHKATILPFEANCMNEVMDDYFLGGGVFRKPKSREDIPDAMICASIKSLLERKDSLTVIIKDGAFKKHLENIENINVSDSLEEFLDLQENKAKLKQLDDLSEKADSIKEYLGSNEFTDALLGYLVNSEKVIEDIYLEDDQILSKEFLEIDSFGERVNFPHAQDIRDLNLSNVAWLSDGTFSIEVEFTTSVKLDYCGEYSDYLYLTENTDRDVTLDSMNGDGVCDLVEPRDLKFKGYIELTFEGELGVDELKIHSGYLGSEKCAIEINLEIGSAELLQMPNVTHQPTA
jgi:hypothetical protein